MSDSVTHDEAQLQTSKRPVNKKKGFQKAYFRHWELFKWNKITKKNIFDHNWDQTRKYPLPLRGEKVSLCPAVLLLARYPLLLLIFSLTFPVLHQVEKSDCCTVHCKNAAFTVMFFSFSPRKLQPILFLYNLTLWFGAQLAGGLCLQQKLQVREILSFNFFCSPTAPVQQWANTATCWSKSGITTVHEIAQEFQKQYLCKRYQLPVALSTETFCRSERNIFIKKKNNNTWECLLNQFPTQNIYGGLLSWKSFAYFKWLRK